MLACSNLFTDPCALIFTLFFFTFINKQMDSKTFYGARTHKSQALVPEHPEDSDADLSDYDDQIEDPVILLLHKRNLKLLFSIHKPVRREVKKKKL